MQDNNKDLQMQIDEFKNKIDNKFKQELVEMITNILIDFEEFNYCDNLKKRYNITEINFNNIDAIFKTNSGLTYLYDMFYEFKSNEQLKYYNEISIIDSNNYSNIETITECLESLVLEEKDKNSKRKDYER